MFDKLEELLLNFIYSLFYGLLVLLLKLVKLIESFFDIFAGTAKVTYHGESDFLLNVFFNNNAVTNAFWGMTLISIVLAFMFCIYGVARTVTDVSGSLKNTLGKVMSNFFRCMLTLLLLSAILIAGVNISNILLDRINYVMLNADILDEENGDREFTDTEFAAMARVLATVGNYAVNPSYNSRYNVNSCFNAVRGDLYSLQVAGVFDYEYPDPSANQNRHCWQSALALLASAADLTRDLSLVEYDQEVATAFETVVDQLSNNPKFVPVPSVESVTSQSSDGMDTDVLIFLITGIDAANNPQYNTGEIDNAVRKGYINGSKSYTDEDQVRKDFDIKEMDYLVGYVVCIVFVIIMFLCLINLITRLLNLILLYITAPLFVSSMPLDEGAKFQNWTQAFIIQMFTGFGMVIAMRLYMIMTPIIMDPELVFFPGDGTWNDVLNIMARVLLILGSAYAIAQTGNLVTGILAGNPGMAALNQEGQTTARAQAALKKAAPAIWEATKFGAKGVGALGGAIADKVVPSRRHKRAVEKYNDEKAKEAKKEKIEQDYEKMKREKEWAKTYDKEEWAEEYGNIPLPPVPPPLPNESQMNALDKDCELKNYTEAPAPSESEFGDFSGQSGPLLNSQQMDNLAAAWQPPKPPAPGMPGSKKTPPPLPPKNTPNRSQHGDNQPPSPPQRSMPNLLEQLGCDQNGRIIDDTKFDWTQLPPNNDRESGAILGQSHGSFDDEKKSLLDDYD